MERTTKTPPPASKAATSEPRQAKPIISRRATTAAIAFLAVGLTVGSMILARSGNSSDASTPTAAPTRSTAASTPATPPASATTGPLTTASVSSAPVKPTHRTVGAAKSGAHRAGPTSVSLVQIASATDIPVRALLAYRSAATAQNKSDLACHVQWQFLAAFGRMESDHGRTGSSSIDAAGIAVPAIYGPPLNGSKPGVIAKILDSGGNPVRAEGPMQFLPSTFAAWGTGNPQNIDDAARAAARYLCADGRDLSTDSGRYAAALSYNHVDWYATDIQALYRDYLAGGPGVDYPAVPPKDAPVAPTKPKQTKPTASPSPTAKPSRPSSSPAPSSTGPKPVNTPSPSHPGSPTPSPSQSHPPTTAPASPVKTSTTPPSSPAPSPPPSSPPAH